MELTMVCLSLSQKQLESSREPVAAKINSCRLFFYIYQTNRDYCCEASFTVGIYFLNSIGFGNISIYLKPILQWLQSVYRLFTVWLHLQYDYTNSVSTLTVWVHLQVSTLTVWVQNEYSQYEYTYRWVHLQVSTLTGEYTYSVRTITDEYTYSVSTLTVWVHLQVSTLTGEYTYSMSTLTEWVLTIRVHLQVSTLTG